MKKLDELTELLYGPGEAMPGGDMSDDQAMDYVLGRRNGRVYCIVRDWIWIDLEMNDVQREEFGRTGRHPSLVYAHTVIFDSARRFDVGDFVRTSPMVAFEDGFLFRTANSTYVLLGAGRRKRAALTTVGRIF